MLTDLPEDLLEAFLAQDDMENTKRYLDSGRFWWRLSDAQLREGWLATWRTFFLNDRAKAGDILTDLCAELRLREIKPPVQEIPSEERERAMSAAQASVPADVANQRRLTKDLDRFRIQIAGPKN